ncbi:MAG: 2Fe-2S iron-sulfur cluster-binding protein [Planctomycetota bacterium]
MTKNGVSGTRKDQTIFKEQNTDMDLQNIIIINGNEFSFEPGESILDIARRNSIDGACRVCVVEVEGARSLVASCAAPATNNMVVRTESAKVIAARRMVIQLLLSSGNHNCAVSGSAGRNWTEFQMKAQQTEDTAELCPVWGDCKLQDLAFRYQVNGERFNPTDTPYPMETVNPFIVRDFSRCIQCGRCVQACNEVRAGLQRSSGQSSHPLRLSRRRHQNYCSRRPPVQGF